MPELPDATLNHLVQRYGLTSKDALTLLSLDDGERLDYFLCVVEHVKALTGNEDDASTSALGKMSGNW